MESETGPEEGGSTPGSWILVVSPGLHEGGALGPTSLIIIKDLWPNPLQYYVKRKAPPQEVLEGQEEPAPPRF
ncbi:hypothetical protein R6Z07M_019729 [Ovis aries]